MKVKALWFGGGSYSAPSPELNPDDLEEFSSMKQAADVFYCRAENRDGRTPLVEESEMQIFFCGHPAEAEYYPDRIIRFGPRGGVRIERC